MSDVKQEDFLISEEPYYRPVADEVERYEAAYAVRMPVMLKGPTAEASRVSWSIWRGSWASRSSPWPATRT